MCMLTHLFNMHADIASCFSSDLFDPSMDSVCRYCCCLLQGFEGLALGTILLKAGLKVRYLAFLCAAFALTTPVGIAIGLAVGSAYNANSPAALGVEGTFNAISAGILLYNGLVDLIVPSFDETYEETPRSDVVFGMGFVFLFLGAVAMSALAYWA